MTNNDPFFILQHAGGDARPGVLTTPTDSPVNLNVLFSRSQYESILGGSSIENAVTKAAVMSEDIANLSITNKGDTTLNLDELWIDDDGNPVTDESGNSIYAAAQYKLVVKQKYKDVDGITLLELSMN